MNQEKKLSGRYIKYRIVTDEYRGYEAQVWRWYWPFWMQLNGTNTHDTVDEARNFVARHGRNHVVVPEL